MALTDPTRQQALQLMMTRLESKPAQTHVALTGPTRQQALQLMMTRLIDTNPATYATPPEEMATQKHCPQTEKK